jgi:hypothetical protein
MIWHSPVPSSRATTTCTAWPAQNPNSSRLGKGWSSGYSAMASLGHHLRDRIRIDAPQEHPLEGVAGKL